MGSRQRATVGHRPGAHPPRRRASWRGWPSSTRSAPTPSGCCWAGCSPETPQTVHRWQYAPGQWAELPALSEATVRYHLRRWLRAGWVRPQRALGRTWIVPTRRGLDLAGSGYRPWTLVPSQLNHLHAVAVVRLAIETRQPRGRVGLERALTRLRAQRRETWWRPDGGLVVADAAVNGGPPLHTIEVELTPKHLAKLQQVFEHRYPGEVQTTYFTPPAHQDGLQRRLAVLEQATRARNEPWSRVNVVPLPAAAGPVLCGGGMNVAPATSAAAGGAAHQLPGHLPAGAGAVELQRGRPGRLPGHPLGDRAPGPGRLVGHLPGRRRPARRRGRDLRGHRRRPRGPAAAARPPVVAARCTATASARWSPGR